MHNERQHRGDGESTEQGEGIKRIFFVIFQQLLKKIVS